MYSLELGLGVNDRASIMLFPLLLVEPTRSLMLPILLGAL